MMNDEAILRKQAILHRCVHRDLDGRVFRNIGTATLKPANSPASSSIGSGGAGWAVSVVG
jgi:hypothetical protein